MRILSVILFFALVCCAPTALGQGEKHRRPGFKDAEQAEQKLPIDPPRNTVRLSVDPAKLKQEAADLSKLVATVQEQLDEAAKGLLHKDLEKNLKQVEKMARHLRSEVTPQ